MKIIKKISLIKKQIKKFKDAGQIVGFVPTMGAIHEGHLSLVKIARQKADIVIVSIFVNSRQFNNRQDYEKYPRVLKEDIEKLAAAKVDILFVPDPEEIYPENFLTNINISKITDRLCGKDRPGHFDAVSLIIVKLFNIITPDIAVFGQKDFQQLQVIRKLVRDLNIGVKIIGAPIIREKSGLALSSRNMRLSEKSRKIAPEIYRILFKLKSQLLKNSHSSLNKIIYEAEKELLASGIDKIDYLEICDEENLQLLKNFNPQIKSRIFVAVYLGEIRLIDNIKLY